ncbi:MAG: hypothetical protein AAGA96_16620 [Verrucomicrobiota bacterium]
MLKLQWIRLVLVIAGVFMWVPAAAEVPSALEAWEALVTSTSEAGDEPVLGLVGFYGAPRPPQWLILTNTQDESGVLRESVISRGQVAAERKFSALPGQDVPDIAIPREEVNIDSVEAFRIAEATAKASWISFDSVHYQLRCRDHGKEPIWMLSLMNSAQVSVGVIYLSARSGEILRLRWQDEPVEKHSSSMLGSVDVKTARQAWRDLDRR